MKKIESLLALGENSWSSLVIHEPEIPSVSDTPGVETSIEHVPTQQVWRLRQCARSFSGSHVDNLELTVVLPISSKTYIRNEIFTLPKKSRRGLICICVWLNSQFSHVA